MRCNLTLFIVLTISIIACRKNSSTGGACLADAPTVRTIENRAATVKFAGGNYYIIENGAIDNRLLPCNLSAEFQADNLNVRVSGDVKASTATGFGPCCTEGFVITKISR